jgi:multiple antibiotic resistance protein
MFEGIADIALNVAKAVLVLFIVVDPFGNIPIFMGLTEKMLGVQKRKIFNTAIVVSIVLLLAFALAGQEIFSIFGVSIFSFEVAGGILLLIISIRILVSGSLEGMSESPESIGAVPIAIPLLVGPGAITTTILNIQEYGIPVTVLSVFVVLAVTWVVLRYIDTIHRFLGNTGAIVIARVMALLIAAIAIQYVLFGVTHFIQSIQ